MSNSTSNSNAPMAGGLTPEAMLTFNRSSMDASSRAWNAYLGAWHRFGQELVDFAADRLRKDTEFGESLSKCRNWNETADVRSRWMRAALNDYSDEAEKVMQIMSVVSMEGYDAQKSLLDPKKKKGETSAPSSTS